MKKIDFHMHTVPTDRDAHFEYSFETLERYVAGAELDAIAITNHDMFDLEQFISIRDNLDCIVYPGIEINVESGHLLLISDHGDLDDFKAKADLLELENPTANDRITVEKLEQIYGDLGRYLLIPHYDKNPSIGQNTIISLGDHMVAGEVSSQKKFLASYKNLDKLCPVLFSDQRMMIDLPKLPTRQTYLNCGDLNLSAIKQCFRERKVSLSLADGNAIFPIFDDGQMLSTGLNVCLGARSSGKTWTLDAIAALYPETTKYIEQFSLVQKDEALNKRHFEENLETRRSQFSEDYLAGFKRVVDDIIGVNLNANEREVERYIDVLLKAAEDADKQDAYAKTALFNESSFSLTEGARLGEVIEATIKLIENLKYRDTITKHIELGTLRRLACELIEILWSQAVENKRFRFVNNLVRDIKQGLRLRTAAVQLEDVDLYKVALDVKRVERFNEIAKFLQSEYVISQEGVQTFTVVAKKRAFRGAQEVRAVSSVKSAFSSAFERYEYPYEYLQKLLSMDELPATEHYRLFAKIDYEILNREGNIVSGGERSEFRLLQEIKDAQNFDMLLIDEPESSFDNVFLRSDVNKIIRDLSNTMPVVVVTHNNTVGASIGADYLLHTRKENIDGETVFKIYSGYPTDKSLKAVDNTTIHNHTMMMDALEAGTDSYEARRRTYEAIKD